MTFGTVLFLFYPKYYRKRMSGCAVSLRLVGSLSYLDRNNDLVFVETGLSKRSCVYQNIGRESTVQRLHKPVHVSS